MSLTPEYRQILHQQTIDERGPGTVVRDFEMLVRFIGRNGPKVSAKQGFLPLKVLDQLNAQLTHPIAIGLVRPQQKSYPHLHALYLLLRATGLGRVEGTRSTKRLVLDEAILEAWRSLNSTERYFTLLEAWLLRGRPEILGERASFGYIPIMTWSEFFQRIPKRGLRIAGDRNQESLITYFLGTYTLALLELFGLISVEHGKPEPDKGWRVVRVRRTVFGDALLHALFDPERLMEYLDQYASSFEGDFGALQPILQPIFPAWQHNLRLPEPEFHDGTYIFKVSLGKVWRRIAIPGKHDLDSLSTIILQAYDFDFDHLYEFIYKNRFGLSVTVHHPDIEEFPCTEDLRVGDLQMQPGTTMTYVYDFGDYWEFDVTLERIDPVDARLRKPRILEAHGEAPDQYPDWDEEW